MRNFPFQCLGYKIHASASLGYRCLPPCIEEVGCPWLAGAEGREPAGHEEARFEFLVKLQ